MEDVIDGELRDYKFFCFHGEPKAMYIVSGRSINQTKFDFYEVNGKCYVGEMAFYSLSGFIPFRPNE